MEVVVVQQREQDTPAIWARSRESETSARFTQRQRDRAYVGAVERYVAWARELLDDTPRVIDSPAIREARLDAARAVLTVLLGVMVKKALDDGEAHPLPGLIAYTPLLEEHRLAKKSVT
jgi:hypothetical protein